MVIKTYYTCCTADKTVAPGHQLWPWESWSGAHKLYGAGDNLCIYWGLICIHPPSKIRPGFPQWVPLPSLTTLMLTIMIPFENPNTSWIDLYFPTSKLISQSLTASNCLPSLCSQYDLPDANRFEFIFILITTSMECSQQMISGQRETEKHLNFKEISTATGH